MKAASSFTSILALRGRVVIFTPSAIVGLRFEQHAERHHAQVVTTRGWADATGPLHAWGRIHASREYGVLSCDQQRYVTGFRLPCTDLVWVGDCGDPYHSAYLWSKFQQAMNRAHGQDEPARQWTLAVDAL